MSSSNEKSPTAFWVGVGTATLLMVLFFVLKANDSNLLDLPVQWLFVAAIPILLGLILGGYVQDLKAGDYGCTFVAHEILEESKLIPDSATRPASAPKPCIPQGWPNERAQEYGRTHGYMLAHIYRPSQRSGQMYDISIFVVKHEKGTNSPPRRILDEIASADFFFGESWENRIFHVNGENGFFGVRTHAWGTFFAACRLTFKDETRSPVTLYRYVDFFMSPDSERA